MADAGWYPDPGGAPSRYRYWDGQAWSSETTDAPLGGTDAAGASLEGDTPFDPSRPIEVNRLDPITMREGNSARDEVAARRQRRGLIGLLVGVVALAVLIGVLVNNGTLGNQRRASGNPTGQLCPVKDSANASLDPHPNDGRVHGGRMSYPQQGAPWSSPKVDDRVPFGRDARTQDVTIEHDYQPGADWVAGLLIAQLASGDGFATPQQAIETVATCIVGAFYGENKVERNDRENRAMSVEGHDAWYLDTHLTFDIQGLQAKGETAIIVIVRTAQDSMSIYYASIPDNADPHMLATGKALVSQLRVDG